MNRSKQLRRALATLVATARVRWSQKQAKLHNLREQNGSTETVLLANIAEGTHDGNITKAVLFTSTVGLRKLTIS